MEKDEKKKLKESFSLFTQSNTISSAPVSKEKANPAVNKNEIKKEIPKKEPNKIKEKPNLNELFKGEEKMGYSAVQVKRIYLSKIEDLAKKYNTTKTNITNIIIENFLKDNELL